MSKGRQPTHYIIERIFNDPEKWGADDRKEKYLRHLDGEGAHWGTLYEAKVFDSLEHEELPMLIEEGCVINSRHVKLVLTGVPFTY